MRVFVAGGTGVIGRPLVARLVAAGHTVTATTRRPESAEILAERGATPAVVDALDRQAVIDAVAAARPEVVIHQLTAIPPRIDPRRVVRDLAATNRLRIDGTRHLIEAAAAAGAHRFVAQSVAFAYAPSGEGLKSEDDSLFLNAPEGSRPLIEAIESLESQTLERTDLEGVVLRYGFLYGPGTIYEQGGSFHQDVMSRRVPILGRGTGVFSFLHVEDAAAATVEAVDAPPGVYNVVDDYPTLAAEFLRAYAQLAGARPPFRVPAWVGRFAAGSYGYYLMVLQRGASNARAKEVLGWTPSFADWREGMHDRLRDRPGT